MGHGLLKMGMGWAILLIVAVLAFSPSVSSLPDSVPVPFRTPFDQPPLCSYWNNDLISNLEDMKLKISQLETKLEENTRSLDAKGLYLEEKEKQIEEMTHQIHSLQNALVDNKKLQGDLLNSEEKIYKLEEEVRTLWATSRQNNFNIHILESKAHDAEETLQELVSKVEMMETIVTEQWIQIRQLEQGLQMTQVQILNVHETAESTRCTFVKFIKAFNERHFPKVMVVLSPYLSGASYEFKRIMSVARVYHHELQRSVKQVMDWNEFTAPLANREVVFFVASALITFPAMIAWILYSSCFG